MKTTGRYSELGKVGYNNEYNGKHYDRINLVIPKGEKALIQEVAASRGVSVNVFINSLIDAELSKDSTLSPESQELYRAIKKARS